MVVVRRLSDVDQASVVSFLNAHAESSMFLLSNIASVGIGHPETRFGGDYWGTFDNAGRLAGVLGHFWNDNIMIQSPDQALRQGLIASFRHDMAKRVAGVLGPTDQVEDVLIGLELKTSAFAVDAAEGLFALPGDALRMPDKQGRFEVIHWKDAEPALMQQWLVAYNIDALGASKGVSLEEQVAEAVSTAESFDRWVLSDDGQSVALAGFNARLPKMVQVGPVWTPPERRGRGYARLLLAHVLRAAFDSGVEKAILFTANPAAEKAYRAIGFVPVGSYRLAILKEPVSIRK